MAADVRTTVKTAAEGQFLVPVTISEELEQKFLKKTKSSAIKLIPVTFIVAAIVLGILFLLVYFLKILAISTIAIFCIIFPIYGIYDAIATSKAIKNHDYEFFYGEIAGKTDNGNYKVKGIEELVVRPLLCKKDYNAGEKAIIARLKDDLSLIVED